MLIYIVVYEAKWNFNLWSLNLTAFLEYFEVLSYLRKYQIPSSMFLFYKSQIKAKIENSCYMRVIEKSFNVFWYGLYVNKQIHTLSHLLFYLSTLTHTHTHGHRLGGGGGSGVGVIGCKQINRLLNMRWTTKIRFISFLGDHAI